MIRYFLSLIVVAFLACACSADNDIVETFDVAQPEGDSIIMVGIKLVGDINVEEMPLTRGLESDDLIGIHIFKNNGGNSFCFGLFKDLTDVKVALQAGSSYVVKATMQKGRDWLNGNVRPFIFYTTYLYYPQKGNPQTRERYFEFNSNNQNVFIYGGYEDYLDEINYDDHHDSFLGYLSGYIPVVNGNIELSLRRVSYGIKMKVIGLTDGSLSIKCWHNKGTDYVLYNNNSITADFEGETKIFNMCDISSAYTYADDDYQEAVKLNVVWTRGNGIVQNLGTKTAYVKRNAVNVFKIKLSTNDTDVDVDVDPEEGDMDGEDEDLSN